MTGSVLLAVAVPSGSGGSHPRTWQVSNSVGLGWEL